MDINQLHWRDGFHAGVTYTCVAFVLVAAVGVYFFGLRFGWALPCP